MRAGRRTTLWGVANKSSAPNPRFVQVGIIRRKGSPQSVLAAHLLIATMFLGHFWPTRPSTTPSFDFPYPTGCTWASIPRRRRCAKYRFGAAIDTFHRCAIRIERNLDGGCTDHQSGAVGANGVHWVLRLDAAGDGRQPACPRWSEGAFGVDALLAYSAVCGTGLDVIPMAGDVPQQQIERILSDVATSACKMEKAADRAPAAGQWQEGRRIGRSSTIHYWSIP